MTSTSSELVGPLQATAARMRRTPAAAGAPRRATPAQIRAALNKTVSGASQPGAARAPRSTPGSGGTWRAVASSRVENDDPTAMERALRLLAGLFSDPKAALYQAREEENRGATLLLAGGAIFFHSLLLIVAGKPLAFSIVAAAVGFAAFFLPCWIGGALSGGTGSTLDFLQLCGAAYLPLWLMSTVSSAVYLGFVGSVAGWIVMYYVMKIGHNFSTFEDVRFAYALAFVFSLAASFGLGNVLAAIARTHGA